MLKLMLNKAFTILWMLIFVHTNAGAKTIDTGDVNKVTIVSADLLEESKNQLNLLLDSVEQAKALPKYIYTMPLQEESNTPCVGTVKDVLSMAMKRIFLGSKKLRFIDITSQISGVNSHEWNEKTAFMAHKFLKENYIDSMYSVISSSTGCEVVKVEDISSELGIGFGQTKFYSIFSKSDASKIDLKRSCMTTNINIVPQLVAYTKPRRHCVYFTSASSNTDINGSVSALYMGKSKTFLQGTTPSRAFEYLSTVSIISSITELLGLPQSIFLPYAGEEYFDNELDLVLMTFNHSSDKYKQNVLRLISRNWGNVKLSNREVFSFTGDKKVKSFLAKVASKAYTTVNDYDGLYEYLIRNKEEFQTGGLSKKYLAKLTSTDNKIIDIPQVSLNSKAEERIVVRPTVFKTSWKINVDASKCTRKKCKIYLQSGTVDLYLLDGVEDALENSAKYGRVTKAECNADYNPSNFNCEVLVTKGTKISTHQLKKNLRKLNRSS